MKKKLKSKKEIQKEFAKKNIKFFFELLKKRFEPNYDKEYIKEIKNLAESFNIRLERKYKLLFCKKCNTFFNVKTRKIRFNSKNKTKEIICLNCGHIRRFRYNSQNKNNKESNLNKRTTQ